MWFESLNRCTSKLIFEDFSSSLETTNQLEVDTTLHMVSIELLWDILTVQPSNILMGQ